MTCPHCGTANPAGTPFCNSCGTELPHASAPAATGAVGASDALTPAGPDEATMAFDPMATGGAPQVPDADPTFAPPGEGAVPDPGATQAVPPTAAIPAPEPEYGMGGGAPPTGDIPAVGGGYDDEPPSRGRAALIASIVAIILVVGVGLFLVLRSSSSKGPNVIADVTLPPITTTTAPKPATSKPAPGTTPVGTVAPGTTAGPATTTTIAKPVTTLPPPPPPPPPTPTTTEATTTTTTKPPPMVDEFKVPATVTACPDGFTQINISWKTTDAASVTISIDNPDGPYQTNLPPQGNLDVPFSGCTVPVTHRYYITAIAADGTKVTELRTVTYQGGSPVS